MSHEQEVSNIIVESPWDVCFQLISGDSLKTGFNEVIHQPLRSSVYTKQVSELIEQHKIVLIGSSYSAAFWDKDKQNEIYEDVDMIFTNMASVGRKPLGV